LDSQELGGLLKKLCEFFGEKFFQQKKSMEKKKKI